MFVQCLKPNSKKANPRISLFWGGPACSIECDDILSFVFISSLEVGQRNIFDPDAALCGVLLWSAGPHWSANPSKLLLSSKHSYTAQLGIIPQLLGDRLVI